MSAGDIMTLLALFVFGHALADYPLQGEYMAIYKSRHARNEKNPQGLWAHLLTAHSIIHGGLVGLISGSLLLGVVEACLHWLIDLAKCEHKTNLHQDQALHVICKIGYVLIFTMGWLPVPWWLS